jgi:general secretion pathway protein E
VSAQLKALRYEEHLVQTGLISLPDLARAERYRRETGQSIIGALRSLSVIQPQALAETVSAFYGVPLVEDGAWQRTHPAFPGITPAFLRSSNVFPLADTAEGVLLAMEDPSDSAVLNGMRLALQRPVVPRVAMAQDIQAAIDRSARNGPEPGIWVDDEAGEEVSSDVEHLRDMALGTPVIRFVNQLVQDAVHARATDIHIEPFDGRVLVRLRVDGMLREVQSPPYSMGRAIVSRIKILSGLNIAERRLPQDGRARVRIHQHRLDLRVATMPTIYGESVAVRLLDNVRRALDFAKLGFNERDEQVIRKHLAAPYGLMLVTGPTGSGKTTTLATALSLLNEAHRKILTIEDPIEYEIEGVNQTQSKPAIGLTFANALRSFLRHDPDVMMVGEMRDGETASIGIHAALTGHLVLSTLHTNTAAGAIPRLLDMGIDAFLLASSLRCVIGQRLVRVLCPHCKEPTHERSDALFAMRSVRDEAVGRGRTWRAVGCERCFGTGYADRVAISEVLDVDDEIRDMIQPSARPAEIEAVARRRGMTTMILDGLRKCDAGITTPDEVRRVAIDV